MLHNLYLLPALIGVEQERLGIWHGTNWEEKSYAESAPPEVFALWDEAALEWVKQTYQGAKFREVRDRYIAICEQLKSEPVGPRRSQLVQEAFQLRIG